MQELAESYTPLQSESEPETNQRELAARGESASSPAETPAPQPSAPASSGTEVPPASHVEDTPESQQQQQQQQSGSVTEDGVNGVELMPETETVSYTHLTLPTTPYV